MHDVDLFCAIMVGITLGVIITGIVMMMAS